jgi:hypothetical protein
LVEMIKKELDFEGFEEFKGSFEWDELPNI